MIFYFLKNVNEFIWHYSRVFLDAFKSSLLPLGPPGGHLVDGVPPAINTEAGSS